jgi:hypothetical protein
MQKVIFVYLFLFSLLFMFSCSKDSEEPKVIPKMNENFHMSNRSRTASTNNNMEVAIVLGRKRNNPYTLANMTAAINKIYKTSFTTVAATHKYVKFFPSTVDHLAALEEWETEKLTPVFTFPLDYEIVVPGDYYFDPAVSDSIYTYRYTSVEVDVPLPNVPFTVIEDLFIPPINSYVAEQAFYQVGEPFEGDTSPHPDGPGDGDDPNDDCNPGCTNYPCCKLGWIDCNENICGNDPFGPLPCPPGSPNWPACLDLFPPVDPPNPNNPNSPNSPEQQYCECTEYVQGTPGVSWTVITAPFEDCSLYEFFTNNYWVECNTINEPPPPPVVLNECGCPIPSNPRFPAGCIEVDEGGANGPVQQVMVVLKDTWFTSDIVFTNNEGCWQHNESYSGYVWMTVKFKNNNCKIRAMRRDRILEAVGVADDYVDRFDAPPYNNIYVHYANDLSDNQSLTRRYWACAHTINGDNEYRMGATGDGIPLPRTGLNYFLNAANNSVGGAPMLQNNFYGSWPQILAALLVPVVPILSSPLYPDITNNYDQDDNAESYKRTQFHELGHASHYTLVGESFWFPYRNHIVNNDLVGNGVYGSFGNFAFGSDPDRVALGEAVGFYVGNLYGDDDFGGEGNQFIVNFIPTGLLYDLNDTDVDLVRDPNNPSITRNDIITGFTPAMFFGALRPNINSIRSFRNRLSTLSLGSTPNTLSENNALVDVYDVFN